MAQARLSNIGKLSCVFSSTIIDAFSTTSLSGMPSMTFWSVKA